MAGGSLSDILTTIQQGVVALNKLGSQIKGSFTNILSRFVVDEANITLLQTPGQGLVNVAGSLAVSLSELTNSLSGDVTLNNVATYFTGPSVAQGTTGTWFASGSVTVLDTAGAASFAVKLWDGTTVIDSTKTASGAGNNTVQIALSGILASPAGNIRISVKDTTAATGKILFNQSGESKDSIVSVIRIA